MGTAAAMIISTIISLIASYGYTITDEVLRNDAQVQNSDVYQKVVESANSIAKAVQRGQDAQDTINQVISSVQSIASTLASRGAISKYITEQQLRQKAVQQLQDKLQVLQLRQQQNETRAQMIPDSMYSRKEAESERQKVLAEKEAINTEAAQIQNKIEETFGGIKK